MIWLILPDREVSAPYDNLSSSAPAIQPEEQELRQVLATILADFLYC